MTSAVGESLQPRQREESGVRGVRLKGLSFIFVLCLTLTSSGAQQTSEDPALQHFTAAQQAEKAGDYDKASAEYREVLKLHPEVAEVYNNLGLIYYIQAKNQQ